jgi:ferredoxin
VDVGHYKCVEVDVVDDGERLESFADASLDFVVSSHFLEHCQDPIRAFGRLPAHPVGGSRKRPRGVCSLLRTSRAKGPFFMPHVITARCMDCRYTDCVEVCPVECFYEVEDPAMLVIDPDTCIDCQLCVPECPVNAIYADSEVPEHYQDWIEFNRDLFALGTNITKKKGPLPAALDLDGVRQRETTADWPSVEPGAAAH